MRTLRVLYLQPCTSFGGAERQASIVGPSIGQWGLDVLPLVGPGTTVIDLLQEQGVSGILHSRSFPGGGSPQAGWRRMFEPLRWLRSMVALAAEIEALIERRRIDVVMAAMPVSWLAAAVPAHRRGVPIVWRAGGTRIHDVWKPLLSFWSGQYPPTCSSAAATPCARPSGR